MSRRRKILVLSDRFPPDTEGGAEVSLADTLRALPADRFDVHVVTFGASAQTSAHPSATPVTRLPDPSRWPRHLLAARAAGGTGGAYLAAAMRDIGDHPSAPLSLAGFLGARALGATVPHPGSERLSLANSTDLLGQVQAAFDRFGPDLVHADNKDSILIATALNRGSVPLVAMVRDHRFFCAHAGQSMMIGSTPCRTCAFGCTGPGVADRLARRAMGQVREARQAALACADHVASTSRFLSKQIGGVLSDRTIVALGNPHPDPGDIDAALARASAPTAPTLVFAGNLRAEKGAVLLAEVARGLHAIKDLRIIIAGRGPAEDQIRRIAGDSGLADRFAFPGFLDRATLYRTLAEATVIVAPTLWPEPFGRLPLEAAMVRRPIVASADGGHLETIIDGKTGILFPTGDRDALTRALLELLANPTLADTLGGAARHHVEALFAPGIVAERLAALWDHAVDKR